MEQSVIQQQYPLNVAKKLKKKILTRSITILVFEIIIVVPVVLIWSFSMQSDTYSPISIPDTFPVILPTLIAVALVYLVSLGIYTWYIKLYIRRYFYDLNDNFITIKKGAFAPTEIHVQYQKIQDVYVDQDIWDRIFGLYDVHIASATVTSGMEAHIDGISAEAAEGLKEILLGKIKNPYGSGDTLQPQSQQLQQPVFQSDQEVSTKNFPIENRWILAIFLQSISGVLIFCFIIWAFLSKLSSGFLNLSGLFGYAVLYLVVFLFSFIGRLIWKSNFYFSFSPDYILMKSGIFGRQDNHVPYNTIQDIVLKQNIPSRILNLWDVQIQNAAQGLNSSIIIPGQSKEHAAQLKEVLQSILGKNKNLNNGL